MAVVVSPPEYQAGDSVGEFRVTRKEPLDHLHGFYYELEHEATGARFLHIATPDENNAFCVTFPTVPGDSTGAPHILEHVSLMGSQQYPVKDPFFAMYPRSLQTFMNASTADDHTNFLFSTRNEKDFYNLMNVYLDATFYPLLRETSFRQDGWRLEYEVPDDPASSLRYKGVVFNEMKGYMATALWVAHQALGTALYPGLTYAVNAGGDPAHIPDLTYEALKRFKETHYHPSNAFFVTYGNLPLERTVAEIEEKVLSKFERITPEVDIAEVERLSEPVEHRVGYPLAKDEDQKGKSVVVIGWVTCPSADSYEVLTLNVLEEYLLGNPASPLKKALIDSGLGDALADFSGLSTEYKEAAFSAGLKGTDEEAAEKIEEIVLSTLKGQAEGSLDSEQIEAALHQLEIRSREVSNTPYPYGIRLVYTVAAPLTHGADPYPRLQFDRDVERLRKEMAGGGFFEEPIRRWFLDNPHRARLIVHPDQQLGEEQEKEELARLEGIEKELSDSDKQRLVEEAKVLKEIQEAKPDPSVLPTLELSDVPMTLEDVPHTIEEIAGAKVGLFPQPTNGITYIDIRTDFSALSEKRKDLLALFAYALTKSGAGDDDYVAMAKRINASTGGIQAGAAVRITAAGGDDYQPYLALSGKALARNHRPFVEILRDLMAGVSFEPKRLKELIAEYKAQYDTFVTLAGSQFALLLAASKLGVDQALQERLQGLTQYRVLRDLDEKSEADLEEVVRELDAIRGELFLSGALQICITTDEKDLPEVRGLVEEALGVIEGTAATADGVEGALPELVHEARTAPVPVAYNAKVFKAVEFSHPDSPALLVLSQYLGNKYLIRELREKRGAYGAAAQLGRENGLFIFVTSQDPNVAETFRVIGDAVRHVMEDELDPHDIKEAILSSCRQVDPLQSPDMKGRSRFFDDIAGYSLDVKSTYKKRLLEVTEADVRRVAGAYLKDGNAAMASISNAEKVEEANQQMEGIFQVSPI